MVERATTNGQPDISSILLHDMRQCESRLGTLIERRKRLPSLRGDMADVERVLTDLEHDAIGETRDVLNKLHTRVT